MYPINFLKKLEGINLRLSRKYIGLIIIGIIVLIFVVYNFTSTPNDYKITSNNISTNSFVGYGVSFNFPSDWNISTDNNGFGSSQGIIINVSPNEEDDEAPLFEVLIVPNQGMSDSRCNKCSNKYVFKSEQLASNLK